MKIVSVNVGRPRLCSHNGETFSTSIFKEPVAGRVMLRRTNLDGDRQADLSVHGGRNKAVYGYPSEHYGFWREGLGLATLPWGALGENFTTEGLLEKDVRVGDRFRVGGATIAVKTPRLPCFKLAAKFKRDDMIERFLESGRSGYYFSVIEEGEVGAGDEFEFLGGESPTLSIFDTFAAYTSLDLDLLHRAAAVTALPESWRERFQTRADAIQKAMIERNSAVR
ncbi:MAG TPA: MOSC domain-containing protein [Terriglobales bacterium]|nr:MOSC domain-containing protein [Terriglobales bacterium]